VTLRTAAPVAILILVAHLEAAVAVQALVAPLQVHRHPRHQVVIVVAVVVAVVVLKRMKKSHPQKKSSGGNILFIRKIYVFIRVYSLTLQELTAEKIDS
jgi:glucan phosphoethanolaminetransferase (alkaline phosphatase superfamily)